MSDARSARPSTSRLPVSVHDAEDPAVREEWDRRYAGGDRLWSGRPNGALVAEVARLAPGDERRRPVAVALAVVWA